MAIDFNKWNEEFGENTLKELKDADLNDPREIPDGSYLCRLEKLELAESSKKKPMIKGMFRIVEGEYKKRCLFVNQVIAGGYPLHITLEFLRSLNVFDDSEIDFDGDYAKFNDLLLDIAEEAESMSFKVKKSMDGEYTRLEVEEAY